MIRGEDGRATKVRYGLPRHKAANWVGPGRGRKSTRPGANGVVELVQAHDDRDAIQTTTATDTTTASTTRYDTLKRGRHGR